MDEKLHNDFDDIDWESEEVEISEVDLEQSLTDIQEQVYSSNVDSLPKALRASAKRAVKASTRTDYFIKMKEHHLNIVLKKAKLLYDENSKEYQEVVKFVEGMKS
jgi:hypothetical protein